MNLEDKYSILIPSRNRQENIKKVLKFYADLNCKIIICDSSDTPFLFDIKSNVEYFYLDKDINFFEKLKYGIEKVKTEYVLLHPDDDFVAHHALKECMQFLFNNPDYVTAIGQSIGYNVKNGKANFVLRNTGQFLSLKNKIYSNERMNRMEEILIPYSQIIWAFHKTDILKSFFSIDISWLNGIALYERFFSLFMAMAGNVKFLPLFFGAREFDNSEPTENYSYAGMDKVLSSQKHKSEIETICNILAKNFIVKENATYEYAYSKMIHIFDSYKIHLNESDPNVIQNKKQLFFSKYNPDLITNKIFNNSFISNDRFGKSYFSIKGELPCFSNESRIEINKMKKIIENN